MAVNFRLSYNTGRDYVDLFPYTKIEAIKNTEKILKYTTLDITVPSSSELVQTIPASITDKQSKAPFDVELIDVNQDTMYAYCAIDQVEVTKEGIKIIRVSRGSDVEIKLRLRFREAGL